MRKIFAFVVVALFLVSIVPASVAENGTVAVGNPASTGDQTKNVDIVVKTEDNTKADTLVEEPTSVTSSYTKRIRVEDDGPGWVLTPAAAARAHANDAVWANSPAGGDGRIVVISDEVHVVLAVQKTVGTTTTLKEFPIATENGTKGLKNGEPVTLQGQLCDGHMDNITPLQSGGLTRNHGIGGNAPDSITIQWWLRKEDGTSIQDGTAKASFFDGNPSSSEINGSFTFNLPGGPRLSPAGKAYFEFKFTGWSDPNNGVQIYPPNGDPPGTNDKFWVNIQHDAVMNLSVEPTPAAAGENISISGNVISDDGFPITDEGLVVSFEQSKGTYTTIGETMPAGWYVDDVVIMKDSAEVLNDNFEGGLEQFLWTHSGAKDEWEAGIPKGNVGPASAHTPVRCAGTDLDNSYEIQTDSYLVSPLFNMSGASRIVIGFWDWADISSKDAIYLDASPDDGARWFEVPNTRTAGLKQTTWSYKTFVVDTIEDPAHPGNLINFIGSGTVKFRWHIQSIGYSVKTDDHGEFSFNYKIPSETTPDAHNVKVEHPSTSLFLASFINVSVNVRRVCHFVFDEDNSSKIAHRQNFVELRGRLLDNMNEVPISMINGIPQSYSVDISWDKSLASTSPSDIVRVDTKNIILDSANESRNGWIITSFPVPLTQPLGFAQSCYSFTGTDYYKPVDSCDLFRVKANTTVKYSSNQKDLKARRGMNVTIIGYLVVVPEQSNQNPEGDAVPFETLKFWWETKPLDDDQTERDGKFNLSTHIGESHALGEITVKIAFEGTETYEPTVILIPYSVVSDTRIYFEDEDGNAFNYKLGMFLNINGSIKDDLGTPIPQMPVLIRKIVGNTENPLGKVQSGTDGRFGMSIKLEQSKFFVGNLTIKLLFDGTKIFEPSQNVTNYAVYTPTLIQRDMEKAADFVMREGTVSIEGHLFENWSGQEGRAVEGEQVTISMGNIELKAVYTRAGGYFNTTVTASENLGYGVTSVKCSFKGSRFYRESEDETRIVIGAYTNIEFQDVIPNETVNQGDNIKGKVYIKDDQNMPVANQDITIFWIDDNDVKERGGVDLAIEYIYNSKGTDNDLTVGKIIKENRTDQTGILNFTYSFTGEIRSGAKNETRFLVAVFNGYQVMESILEEEKNYTLLQKSSAKKAIEYKVPEEPIPSALLLWVMLILALVAASVIIGYVFYEINKRRALKSMQTIIRKAADQLVAGNEYALVIFKAYRKLAATMKRYGYMRRESETFREFEDAIRNALPIDQAAMDDFIVVLEEARYSSHEMGEQDRDRAINALRRVQFSLEKIVFSEEQMQQLQAKAAELSTADDVEPEIIVQKGGAPPGRGGPPPATAKRAGPPPAAKPGPAPPPPPPKPMA